MMFSLVPAFSGMLALSLLPTDTMKWVRWGMYILQVFGSLVRPYLRSVSLILVV